MRSSRDRAARALTPPDLSREENAEGVKRRKEAVPDKTASSFALPPSFTSTFACRCRAQRPQGTEQTAPGCGRKVMAKQTHRVILMISVLVLCLPEPFLTLLLRAGTSSTQETRTHLQSLCKAAVSPAAVGCVAVPCQPGDRWGLGVSGGCVLKRPSHPVWEGCGGLGGTPWLRVGLGHGLLSPLPDAQTGSRPSPPPLASCQSLKKRDLRAAGNQWGGGEALCPPGLVPAQQWDPGQVEGMGKGSLEGVSREVFAGSCR